MNEFVHHPFAPVFDKNSKVLLLGSFPSPKSREIGFYFSHPQNRFWRILSTLFGEELPLSNEEKKQFLLKHNLALWDVISNCEIDGASDSSIKNAKVNNIKQLIKNTKIKAVFCLGNTAGKLYKKYVDNNFFTLPSTSPANCAFSFEYLLNKYAEIKKFL